MAAWTLRTEPPAGSAVFRGIRWLASPAAGAAALQRRAPRTPTRCAAARHLPRSSPLCRWGYRTPPPLHYHHCVWVRTASACTLRYAHAQRRLRVLLRRGFARRRPSQPSPLPLHLKPCFWRVQADACCFSWRLSLTYSLPLPYWRADDLFCSGVGRMDKHLAWVRVRWRRAGCEGGRPACRTLPGAAACCGWRSPRFCLVAPVAAYGARRWLSPRCCHCLLPA